MGILKQLRHVWRNLVMALFLMEILVSLREFHDLCDFQFQIIVQEVFFPLMDVGDTCTFCCISYLNVSTHLKFVLVSSCWRLSYRYHIDHLEHSYLRMIMKRLFYTGLLSCQSLADSLAIIQIVAFVKIRRWVFYFSIVPWTSKHCHIHKVNNFECGIAGYAGDIW